MKLKLAVAFAVLLLASAVRADGIQTDAGLVYIPGGSTITSIQDIPDPWAETGSGLIASVVDFTFADGSGQITTAGIYGELGSIDFTTPVADLVLNWDGNDSYAFWMLDNIGDCFCNPNNGGISGTVNWSGPGISSVGFGSGDGDAGIDSVTYALDGPAPSVPEPSSLLLSGIGLAALIGLARRNRTNVGRSIRISHP